MLGAHSFVVAVAAHWQAVEIATLPLGAHGAVDDAGVHTTVSSSGQAVPPFNAATVSVYVVSVVSVSSV